MIRHAITAAALRKAIKASNPTWYARAKALLAMLPPNPTSTQFESLWGDIKEVYIELQGSKCVYCETPIEGNISNDVEHFRPKAKVGAWKGPAWLNERGLVTTPYVTPKGDPGYRDLAYNAWNYAASCKFCNSVLKKNFFPITGARATAGKDPRRMKGEGPLLIYPIGDIDDDPETLIRFVGMHPEPGVAAGTPGYFRALVTIELFRLNDAVRRKELYKARARALRELYIELETRRSPPTARASSDANEWIAILLEQRSPHANCLRCFERLYLADRARARAIIDDAKAFLRTGSVASPPA